MLHKSLKNSPKTVTLKWSVLGLQMALRGAHRLVEHQLNIKRDGKNAVWQNSG
jgi:hypothetical protein